MAVLNFDNYQVKSMSYKRNDKFGGQLEEAVLKVTPKRHISINGDDIQVSLSVCIGSLSDQKSPFELNCEIIGHFTYDASSDTEKVGVDTLVKKNAVAILYPYLRMLISNLTVSTNEFSGYILPTVNVEKFFS
ncbi:protein-export chaperone SecB [Ligilactobacillus equi]|uniref:Preprotein translocase subunit SecB n=1 Tax=Ligilactobacillus equi DPC 6820 TaxID=1392007 RepID=V7HX49_9LACO|nr:protein-export chaperone SecB [Ligilactobacillus equi]ETA74457.1 hypothetical protein LEQ_1650c [Ligilactobacillus equi DPC 6820]